MIARILRWASLAACGAILIGFAGFALDELRSASDRQLQIAAGVSPDATGEQRRERQHGDVREAIEDVNDVLLAPFASVVDDDANVWARRTVATVLGLLLYGVLLGMFARWSAGRPSRAQVRRAA